MEKDLLGPAIKKSTVMLIWKLLIERRCFSFVTLALLNSANMPPISAVILVPLLIGTMTSFFTTKNSQQVKEILKSIAQCIFEDIVSSIGMGK